MTRPLADLPLTEAAALVERRAVSPVELTRACLERIAALDGEVRAFATVMEESALAEAERAEREIGQGGYRGPLHGIPVAIKDLAHVAGVPTKAGSRVHDPRPAATDATVVRRLREAGAVVLGKAATHEYAWSVFTPPTRNPWALDRVPGGSSGGSAAAVAAGMAYAALGSDTAGSIRIPAACCGVVGLKPTYGRVSKAGVIPLSWSLDHVGPIARDVAGAAAFLAAVAGPDPLDPTTADVPVGDYLPGPEPTVRGLRIGVPDRYFDRRVDSAVAAVVEAARGVLAAHGAEVETAPIPALDRALDVHYPIVLAEGAAYHRAIHADRIDEFGEDVRRFLAIGANVAAIDYLEAQRARRAVLEDALAAFDRVDLLVVPTLPIEAPPVGAEAVSWDDGPEDPLTTLIRLTLPFNQTGLPAITVPCGFGAAGLPVGLQLAGPPFAERRVLAAAAAFERLTDWRERQPPVVAALTGAGEAAG